MLSRATKRTKPFAKPAHWTSEPAPMPAAPAPVIVAASPAAGEPASLARVEIVGPVDTPEELSEAFRRIDEVRAGRYAARRESIEQRIDKAIEHRRAAGLPVPTAEEEAAFRQRVDEAIDEPRPRPGERGDEIELAFRRQPFGRAERVHQRRHRRAARIVQQ